jgi:glutathione S-transferase
MIISIRRDLKTWTFSEKYEVVYHGALSLRAAQIQMLLVDVGAEFEMLGPNYGAEAAGENKVIGGKESGVSVFACPVLKQGSFVISQTTAIMNYLADKHGLSQELTTPEMRAKAEQLLQDASDVQGEAYGASKEKEAKAKFIGERLPAWLKHFEIVCGAKPGSSGFLCGTTKAQPCDYVLAAALDTVKCSFGTTKFNETLGEFPAVAAFYAHMTAREGYKAYCTKGFAPQLWEADCFKEA